VSGTPHLPALGPRRRTFSSPSIEQGRHRRALLAAQRRAWPCSPANSARRRARAWRERLSASPP